MVVFTLRRQMLVNLSLAFNRQQAKVPLGFFCTFYLKGNFSKSQVNTQKFSVIMQYRLTCVYVRRTLSPESKNPLD